MLAEQIEQIEFGRGQWLRRSVRADQQPALAIKGAAVQAHHVLWKHRGR